MLCLEIHYYYCTVSLYPIDSELTEEIAGLEAPANEFFPAKQRKQSDDVLPNPLPNWEEILHGADRFFSLPIV